MAAVLIGGAFFRFFKLDQLPPGFTFDEASHALDALDILQGKWMLISPRIRETPAGYMVLVAAAFRLFGATPLVQRAVTATCGLVLVLANFIAVRQVFSRESLWLRTWLALLSSMFLATSFWAVLVSRIGYEYIVPSLFALLGTALFWRSYPGQRWGSLGLAACLVVANFYFYRAAATFLLVIPATLLGANLWARRLVRSSRPRLEQEAEVPWRVFWIFSALIFLLALPVFLRLVSGPAPEAQGSFNAFILSNPANPGHAAWLLQQSLLAHAQTLLGWPGDNHWWGGRPLLEPVMGLSLVAGLFICLKRLPRLPYLFVLVYWTGMLAPAVLTFHGTAANHFRMTGALPPTYILIALAWVELAGRLRRIFAPLPAGLARLAALTPALLVGLVWLPVQTYRDYFITWASDPVVAQTHDVAMVRLVERMERETDPEAVFLLRRRPDLPRPDFTLDFLYSGQAPLRYVPVAEATLHQTLTQMLAGSRLVHLVTSLQGGREDDQAGADPHALVPFLLSRYGRLVSTEETADYTILTYELNSNHVVFARVAAPWPVPANIKPLSVPMQGVELAGIHHELQEHYLQVDLAWRGQAAVDHNYTVFVQLLDAQGQRVAGVDVLPERSFKTLMPNEVMLTHYQIPRPANLPPGSYRLLVGLYYFAGNEVIPISSTIVPGAIQLGARAG